MITTSDFKEGLIYEDDGKILQVISYQHHRKSQSRAKVITRVRNMDSGAVVEINYASDAKFRPVDVRKKDYQFLYADQTTLHFMDVETYEQETLPKERLGDSVRYLVENMGVIGVFFDDAFRTVEIPPNVVVRIASAEPGVRGDSVSNLMKNAVTETGVNVKVPLFIKEGETIRLDTRTGEYVERVK